MTELTLGPVYYLWDGPKWRDFYLRIADEAPVDRVILGETVCSKRQHFIEPYLADVVERLERAGKSVAFSSLALVTLEREGRIVKDLIETSDHPIEVNDLSAIGLIKGRQHLVGPLVNVYNGPTARLLAQRGAVEAQGVELLAQGAGPAGEGSGFGHGDWRLRSTGWRVGLASCASAWYRM